MKTAIELAREAVNDGIFDAKQFDFLVLLLDVAQAEMLAACANRHAKQMEDSCSKAGGKIYADGQVTDETGLAADREACVLAAAILAPDKPGTVFDRFQAAMQARGQ